MLKSWLCCGAGNVWELVMLGAGSVGELVMLGSW